MKKVSAISFIALLIFGFFLFSKSAIAAYEDWEEGWWGTETEEEPPEDEGCSPSMSTWTETEYEADEFKCENELCGIDILKRERWLEYECWDDGCGDSGCSFSGYTYTDPTPYQKLESWQRCEPYQGSWEESIPEYGCQGDCLEIPENDRYYDNPTYSDKPTKNIGNENILLPVKLDWDDVEGWGEPDGPKSYIIRITTSTDESFSKMLDQSEYIPRACLFPSNKTSDWNVKACCGTDEEKCGDESDWSLSANLAPELVAPYDPDWMWTSTAKNVALPITLDWCDVENAGSYRFQVYVIEGGEKVCHPDLLSIIKGEKVCDSWLLRKTRRDEGQEERILYSDFPDENMDFFTKNTTSSWQVMVCDENGFDCSEDYSQLWTLSTEDMPLTTSFLVAPTNDPNGKKPVGLPMVIDWNDKPGVNSFIYEITSVSGGQTISGTNNVSQSKLFNFPQLSLNTLYKWRVKSCWDYNSEKCEPEFSEEWNFKTTGRAPNLTYPVSGEQNVIIPMNLTWENVPGAKSYVLKVDGLNLEKILNEPEFLIDFPEYPVSQETNYSWQVKTCAWDEGKTCGQYSNSQSFKTFRISPPQSPSPGNNGQLFTDTKYVSWENVPGAKAYQYQIKYLSLATEETDEACPALAGGDMFTQPQTTLANSDFVELKCLGQYQWQVRSCLDNNCQEVSNWSNSWSFTLLEGGTGQGGLIPCGRSTDNPKTPWNERKPCQIKHLFLTIKIIIDFLLFRVAPVILVLLTIATGLIFYTSLGQITTMGKVISLWKAAGIGLLIIFFAWTIVNIFLKMVGYNIGVFGNWYELPL